MIPYILLVIAICLNIVSVINLKREIKQWEDRANNFWKMYTDERDKRLSSVKYVGGKHEFGHDYE